MIRHYIPEPLVEGTENMLAGMRIMVYHGRKWLEVHQIEAAHREEFYPHYCGAL